LPYAIIVKGYEEIWPYADSWKRENLIDLTYHLPKKSWSIQECLDRFVEQRRSWKSDLGLSPK
jgi:hypothetical protein